MNKRKNTGVVLDNDAITQNLSEESYSMTDNFATRDDLLGLTDRRFKEVPLPGGKKVRIRNLIEEEKSDFEASILNSKADVSLENIKRQRRRLIAMCVVNEKGNLVFGDGDQDKLRKIDGAVSTALYKACRDHCGFDEGDIEELLKNSAKIPDEK